MLFYDLTHLILRNVQNTNLQTMSINSVFCNLRINFCFDQQEKSPKMIQIIVWLIIIDLGWLMLFFVICRLWFLNPVFCKFQNKACFNQQNKPNYDLTNCQWFRVVLYNIKILHNLQKKTSHILFIKTPPGNIISGY